MVLALKDQWIWDFWLAREGENWHIYFLKADKALGDPHQRHWNVSIGHATSQNLVDWTHLGTCFEPNKQPGFDDFTTWTGSVIKDPEGKWHLFYTGTSRSENGMKQRIGHATSSDMHNWKRMSEKAALDISGPHYEEYSPDRWHDRAMRDPHVIQDPDGTGYLMYFTARTPGKANPNEGGTIGFATSPDLDNWTLQPPVYADGLFGQMEVPQVLEICGRWYCLFCTHANHFSDKFVQNHPDGAVTGTHYLTAPDPRGPWTIATGSFFDGETPPKRYAGKLVKTGDGLKYLAFIHDGPAGEFIGVVSDPMDVEIDANGLLHLSQPSKIRKAV